MIRKTLSLALLAAALLSSGCGSDDTKAANDYVAAINGSVATFESTFSRLQNGFTATSTPAEDVQTLDRFSASVTAATRNLATIKPPGSVAALHRRLIAAVGSYQGVIATAKTAFAGSDARKIIAARTRFSVALTRVSTRITAAIEAINQKLQS